MLRAGAIFFLLLTAGCAHGPGLGPDTPQPALAPPSATANAAPSIREPHPVAAPGLPNPAALAPFGQDSLRELQRAADSAADARALESLANAHPRDTVLVALPLDPGPTPVSAVTWDIDVSAFSDHDRVKYYVDFFQGRSRDRMTIWLVKDPVS